MKKLKEIEYIKLQVSNDKKVYRGLFPISYIREIEKKLDRELQQGDLLAVTLLENAPGINVVCLDTFTNFA